MSSYRYFEIGKFLVCLDQPVLDAVRTMGVGHKRNSLAALGVSRPMRQAAIKAVIKDRLWRLESGRIVELPAFGHIAMQVHRGCKIFDFGKKQVVKVFSREVNAEDISAEIAASKLASQVAAAPRFISRDSELACYREEYICGTHGTDPAFRSGKEILDFYPDVESCLLELIACELPETVAARVHFKRLADSSFRGRWLAAGLGEEDIEFAGDYVEQLRAWLLGQDDLDQLQLVPTHGDFSLVNAISTDDGLRFIDWEGVAPGCVFSDVLNFLFVERYYGRETLEFASEFAAFVDRFRVACRDRFPGLQAATEVDFAFVRRQYYLERLSLLLERKPTVNLCNVVRRSIDMFREFDRESGDRAV